jgi:hypothetical protein
MENIWTRNIFSESLETIIWGKKFFDADSDPGSGTFFTLDPGSWMEKFGSGIRYKYTRFATLGRVVYSVSHKRGSILSVFFFLHYSNYTVL